MLILYIVFMHAILALVHVHVHSGACPWGCPLLWLMLRAVNDLYLMFSLFVNTLSALCFIFFALEARTLGRRLNTISKGNEDQSFDSALQALEGDFQLSRLYQLQGCFKFSSQSLCTFALIVHNLKKAMILYMYHNYE